jgi:hypothetical protein
MTAPPTANMRGGGGPSGLADVLDVLLDKGLVIDAFVRVSLVGIELITIDARVVVASVDTYLRFAEAVNRLDLTAVGDHATLPEMVTGEWRENGSRGSSDGSNDEEERGSKQTERAELERGSGSEERKEEGKKGDDEGGGLMGAIGKAAQKVVDRAKYSD